MTIFNHIVPNVRIYSPIPVLVLHTVHTTMCCLDQAPTHIIQGTYGVMTHFWSTAGGSALNFTVIRYYLDDERT